jgi:hypothetical protein
MWKEVMACFKKLSQNLSEEIERTMKTVGRISGWDLNLGPLDLKVNSVNCSSTASFQTQRENEGFILNLYSCSSSIHGVAAQLAMATNCGMYDWGPASDRSVGTLIFSAKSRMALTVQYQGCVDVRFWAAVWPASYSCSLEISGNKIIFHVLGLTYYIFLIIIKEGSKWGN